MLGEIEQISVSPKIFIVFIQETIFLTESFPSSYCTSPSEFLAASASLTVPDPRYAMEWGPLGGVWGIPGSHCSVSRMARLHCIFHRPFNFKWRSWVTVS